MSPLQKQRIVNVFQNRFNPAARTFSVSQSLTLRTSARRLEPKHTAEGNRHIGYFPGFFIIGIYGIIKIKSCNSPTGVKFGNNTFQHILRPAGTAQINKRKFAVKIYFLPQILF